LLIGILSDTHIPQAVPELPARIAQVFRGVDLILHAGDIYVSSVLDDLESMAPVLAARGDDDVGEVLTDRRVQWKHVLKLHGKTIWLIHYLPYPYPVMSWRSPAVIGKGQEPPDIVVFGHDHCTIVENRGGVLLVNPGSPTFLNYRHGAGTVGLLSINSSEANVHIVDLQVQ
jgi:putative phosphoesterase